MKRKSLKRKKPRLKLGSWLQNFGVFLAGIAAVLEVIFKIVIWFVEQ